MPYRFKPSPYSSHTLLLNELPTSAAGLRLLDVGCAEGYLSEIAAQRGFQVTGVDREGITPPPGTTFVAADLDDPLPAFDAPFDYILCADVLEHLRNPDALLRQLRALLAPGGVLLASLPNSGHLYFRVNVLLGHFPKHDLGLFDRTHIYFFMLDGWMELLESAGFRIGAIASSGTPIGLALPRWEHSPVVRALEWMAFQAARVWKRLFAYQFIVRAGSS